MKPTQDLHVKEIVPLISPRMLKSDLPLSETCAETVVNARDSIKGILLKKDKRMLVVVGPCSIHDEDAALEYAGKIRIICDRVADTLLVVMRVYFEKPRTTTGWKGMINDPHMDRSCNISTGLRRARQLMVQITGMGVPVATELLDPIVPQYIADLVSWTAIGARTTESQTHREMASGLSMPVGYKNSTDGSLTAAVNAMQAAMSPHSFVGIDQDGQTCIVKTIGNRWGHLVMRGGDRPNYDPISIEEACLQLSEKKLCKAIMVDCSHANSGKRFQWQEIVWKSVIDQRLAGNDALTGLMLESNLHEGNQKIPEDLAKLRRGISVTDTCIGWQDTERILLDTHERLMKELH